MEIMERKTNMDGSKGQENSLEVGGGVVKGVWWRDCGSLAFTQSSSVLLGSRQDSA